MYKFISLAGWLAMRYTQTVASPLPQATSGTLERDETLSVHAMHMASWLNVMSTVTSMASAAAPTDGATIVSGFVPR